MKHVSSKVLVAVLFLQIFSIGETFASSSVDIQARNILRWCRWSSLASNAREAECIETSNRNVSFYSDRVKALRQNLSRPKVILALTRDLERRLDQQFSIAGISIVGLIPKEIPSELKLAHQFAASGRYSEQVLLKTILEKRAEQLNQLSAKLNGEKL